MCPSFSLSFLPTYFLVGDQGPHQCRSKGSYSIIGAWNKLSGTPASTHDLRSNREREDLWSRLVFPRSRREERESIKDDPSERVFLINMWETRKTAAVLNLKLATQQQQHTNTMCLSLHWVVFPFVFFFSGKGASETPTSSRHEALCIEVIKPPPLKYYNRDQQSLNQQTTTSRIERKLEVIGVT